MPELPLFQAGSHPDYSPVRPLEEGKVIKIDQVREAVRLSWLYRAVWRLQNRPAGTG